MESKAEPARGPVPAAPDGESWPFVVVGAGAAGLLAAIFAARGGVPTLLLETRPKPGAKIRVSGGGRCNVLPSRVEPEDFHTEGSRNAMRNALLSWPLAEVRAFFEEELAIPMKVEATGKVFPVSDDPREIVAGLLAEAARAGVTLVGDARVVDIERSEGGFALALASGERLACRRLALATGGLSLPKTGSDGAGYEFARRLGHDLLETYPALVPLLGADARWAELSGVSLPARLQARRGERVLEQWEGDLLFTHRGFSGPVVLDISHRLSDPQREGVTLTARWLAEGAGELDWDAHLRGGGGLAVVRLLRERLPRRLAVLLCELAGVEPERRASELPRDQRRRLVVCLEACPLALAGDEGYRTAEVTGGGVPLGEVVTKTLESRRVPGLYFAGEILDVTGRIGGYNFLWAWVSGRKVGRSVAAALAADSPPPPSGVES